MIVNFTSAFIQLKCYGCGQGLLLKTECATTPFATRTEARQVIFEYIEVWYNRQPLHSAIGYLPPAEFEQQFFYPLKSVR
jgi:transposase InsO family protein